MTVAAMDIAYRPHLMAEDSADYVQLADGLLAGRGYTLASGIAGTRIPPLFPMLLAAERLVPVDLIIVSGVVNAILGAAGCVCLYWICSRTFDDRRVAPLAALGLAIYPFHLFNTGYVLKENLAIAALLLTIAVWIKTSASTGVRGIVNKYVAGTTNGYQVFLNNGSLCAWYFRDASNYVYDGGTCTLSTPGYADNQWHHVAFVVDASGGRLYVDGLQTATLGWTGVSGAPTTTHTTPSHPSGGGHAPATP